MALVKFWAGRVFGTNVGNVFIQLEGDEAALTGTLHFNDATNGIVLYEIAGVFNGQQLTFRGNHRALPDMPTASPIAVTANVNPKGELVGHWQSDHGAAGTVHLFPHDQAQTAETHQVEPLPQLYTARHYFGAMEIDRDKIVSIAEAMQRDFGSGQVAITTDTGTEQARFLAAFRNHHFDQSRARLLKIYVQEQDVGPIMRIALVELGQNVNLIMTQGADEAWVLGMLEKLKNSLRMNERDYATNIKRWGVGINQGILVAALVYLPSLQTLTKRAVMMGAVLALIALLNIAHVRYLPHSTIRLSDAPKGLLAKLTPSFISWTISATAGLVATLVAAYLHGS